MTPRSLDTPTRIAPPRVFAHRLSLARKRPEPREALKWTPSGPFELVVGLEPTT